MENGVNLEHRSKSDRRRSGESESEETDESNLNNEIQFFKKNSIFDSVDELLKLKTFNDEDFNVFSLNIRSLRKNFEEIKSILFKVNMKILVLSEVFVTEEELVFFQIEGYNLFSKLRKKKMGGGIIVYVKECLNAEEIKYKDFATFEGLELNIYFGKTNLNLLAIYRPPDKSIKQFILDLETQLKHIHKKYIVITGDMNIDLLKSNNLTEDYENLMAQFGMVNYVQDATREVAKDGRVVKACLDHMYVKNVIDAYSAIFKLTLSDHYMVGFWSNKNFKIKKKINNCNGFNYIDNREVRKGILSEDWEVINDSNLSIDEKYELWVETVAQIYDRARRWKENKNESVSVFKISKECKKLMRERDKKYKEKIRFPKNDRIKNEFHILKNKVSKLVKGERIKVERKCFEECMNDLRLLWRQINEVTGRKNRANIDETIKKYFLTKDNLTLQMVADEFVNTFVKEVRALDLQCNIKFYDEPVNKQTENSLSEWKLLKEEEVRDLVKELKDNKSPGYDKIRMKDIKESEEFIKIVTKIVNDSLSHALVPKKMKISLIRPLYKSGKHDDYKNFRPLQILSASEKILEKSVLNQLSNFLKENKIINENQYAYQEKKSAPLLLQKVIDLIYQKLEENKISLLLFIDFTKAFDTLSKEVILKSLRGIGVSGKALNWFSSYLDDREVIVKIENVLSEIKKWETGVPQGSLLGPILYLISVNDLGALITYFTLLFMFADDTLMINSHLDVKVANFRLQKDFINLQKWAHDKGLVINHSKTKLLVIKRSNEINRNLKIIFHTHQCLHWNQIGCKCNDTIEIVESHKYLGLIFNHKMSWDEQFISINKKLRQFIVTFYRLKNLVSSETLKMIYFGLVESTISYGLQSYGIGSEEKLKQTERLQRKICKLLLPKKVLNNITEDSEIYRSLNILPIEKLYKHKQIAQFYFNETYRPKEDKDKRVQTRRTNYIKPPLTTNKYGPKTLKFEIPRLFNELRNNPELLNLIKIKDVKIEIKKFLLIQ